MATLYFSSPVLPKNIKVEATAGDRRTLLGVAQQHKIPIPFECEDGECGSCLVKITHLDGLRIKAIQLTDKEQQVLKKLGRITEQEEENANVNDIPPVYRLACQTVVTDEDLLIEFMRKARFMV